jgi:signal transduction histidine kinase/CheY-like chemotaxis protein
VSALPPPTAERVLILAPRGRDAVVAKGILREAHVAAQICVDLGELMAEINHGADAVVLTEEAVRCSDARAWHEWVAVQPAWSDFPFIVLTRHGGGLERNPAAALLTRTLGNVSFLERPFHPTTLVSAVETALRGRRRQQECRRLNEELELRVQERASELAAANRQLLAQIEERERVESTLRQLQRLEAVGQLTSGVAHDFNNLLTVVLGNIAFLEKGLVKAGIDGKLAQRLGYMRTAAERGARLTDQLLSFSRRQRLEPKVIDLNEAVAGMRDLLQSTMGIRIETQLSDELWPALVDLTQLELAVLNLSINARDAMEMGGTLSVGAANVQLGPPFYPEEPPAGEYVAVHVTDTGAGMSKDVRSKAFEPFFTTKEIGKGSGLGLSQVLGFAKQSGGGVRIRSDPGEGTTIEIFLPRADVRPVKTEVHLARTDSAMKMSARLILVDDDNAVREVTAATLRELGYTVLEAGSGGAALELLERSANVDLMLIDFAMPGMSGAEVARRVQTTRPALPILFVTGYADRAALQGVSEAQIIGKPFVDTELHEKVRTALARRAPGKVVGLRPC